jgi:hypothetical protein
MPGRQRSRALVAFLDRLEPFKRLGKTLNILAAYRLGASNVVAENINSRWMSKGL